MLRGGVVIITALASVLVLKRKLTFVNWLGCGLVLIGILIVGI